MIYNNTQFISQTFVYRDTANHGFDIINNNIFNIGIFISASSIYAGIQILIKPGKSLNINAVKLEVGTKQTLTYQNSSNELILNDIPNFTLELLKCQKYFIYINVLRLFAAKATNEYAICQILLPTTMRIIPSIIRESNGSLISDTKNIVVTDVSGQSITQNMFQCRLYGSEITDGVYAWCDVRIQLSANL